MSTTLETKQSEYKNAKSQLANIIKNIVAIGELTEDQKSQINSLTDIYNTKKIEVEKDIESTKESYNNSQIDYVKNQILDVKTKILENDSNIQLSVSGTINNEDQISQLNIELGKISTRVGDIENTDSVTNIVHNYYLSTSKTELVGGTWVDTLPSIAEQQGKFLWIKYVKTYSDDSQSETDPICMTGQDGVNGTDGVDGLPGAPGKDGKTYYTWIKYSNNADGSGMTDNPDSLYIGIAVNKTTQTESNNPLDYTWSRIRGEKGERGLQGLQGEKGEQGIPGLSGSNGKTSYFHIKYSSVANPTTSQMTETPNTYIGTYVDYTEADSTDPTRYTWARFQGLQGSKGEQGIPGVNGSDGRTSYLHIKYSNDGGKTFTSNNGETPGDYIGQYTDFIQADSNSVSSYTWTLIKGADGEDGVPGPPGEDGQTLYTWIKYADNASGGGMSNSPSGKTYIGLAYNKTTNVESNNASDYTWSLIKGADGVGVSLITEEYYLSTSKTTQTGGSWVTTPPTWSPGKYIWTRSKIIYTNSSTPQYTTPICDSSWEAVNEIEISDRNYILNSNISVSSTGKDSNKSLTCSETDFIRDSIGKSNITISVDIELQSAKSDSTVTGSKRVGSEVKLLFNDDTYVYAGAWQQLSSIEAYTAKKRLFNVYSIPAGKTIKDIEYSGMYIQGLRSGTVKIGKPKLQISNKHTGWTPAPEDAIKGIDVMYYLSTSQTSLAGGSWSTTAPQWVNGKYMWSKTVTLYNDGTTKESEPTCIAGAIGPQGPQGATGPQGVSVTEVVIEYAKNQSTTTAPTSGWSTTMPSYDKGYYLWMRTRIKYSNNNNYVYSTPVCDESWKVVAQTYSEYEQLKNKFSWLVKSGTSESNMVLTDKLYSLITSKVLIEAKKIELNGSININNGAFRVATNGNLKIGGNSGQVIDNYERAQFEVTSDGNMYSVSKTDVDTYTKISEGYIYCSDGSEDVRIKGGSIVAHSVGSNNIGNRTGTKLTLSGGISEIEICEISGNKFIRPASSDANTRLGSSSNYFYQAWIKNGVTTSSDRCLKENIKYLHKNNGLSQKDFYNFMRDDFLQALYNYIGDTETRISLIAQDILVDKYGNDNNVGQMITNAREAFRNNTTLNIKETQLVNVIGGALRELILRFEKVEAIVNEK